MIEAVKGEIVEAPESNRQKLIKMEKMRGYAKNIKVPRINGDTKITPIKLLFRSMDSTLPFRNTVRPPLMTPFLLHSAPKAGIRALSP